MEASELAGLIRNRRSIRVWHDTPVPESLLLQAVELATWAPNGGNRQNWHFFIIMNKGTIGAIGNAAQAGRDLMASWPEAAQSGALAPPPRPSQGAPAPPPRSPLTGAPAMIAVGTRRAENPMEKLFLAREKVDPKAAQMREWNTTVDARIQSVSAAIAYLLLVLHQMGLGAVWMTGPLPQCKGDIEKLLNMPPDMDLVALIPVGYPGESPTRDRKPVTEVTTVVR
jgi:nitroreductase